MESFLSLLLIVTLFGITYAINDSCTYKLYPSSVVPKLIKNHNTNLVINDLATAKDKCDAMGDYCAAIVLSLQQHSVLRDKFYVLASSKHLLFTNRTMSWRKECSGDCGYRIAMDARWRKYYYTKSCSRSEAASGHWLPWGPWSKCSQSCGRVGFQIQRRRCSSIRVSVVCRGISYQRRPCSYATKCPSSLTDVFGVSGREGFQISGKTVLYTSCLREGKRHPCGNQNTITKEKCRQFDCCFNNLWSTDRNASKDGGEHKCFRPQKVFGMAGMLGWTRWSPWTLCSKSCANGTRYRSRTCTGGMTGSFVCPGPDSNVEHCSLGVCPCEVNPCRNGGICSPNKRLARGYKCTCTNNFLGKHCDYAQPKLSCGNDSITVAFDRRLIVDEGLIDDISLIHFRGFESSLCYAQISQDKTNYVLSVPPPIDRSCGSTINATGEEYKIHNKVLWRQTHGSTSSTVVLLELSCVYNKQLNMTTDLGFGIRPTVRTIASQTSIGTFTVDISLYRDKDYLPYQLLRAPIQIAEGELLYVSVDMIAISIADQNKEVIVLDHCYATDTTSQLLPLYDFIIDGCSTNRAFSTVLENGQSTSGRWGFRVFEWTSQSTTSSIFVVCKAHVCDTGYEDCLFACEDNVTAPISRGGNEDAAGLTGGESNFIDELLQSLTNLNDSSPIRRRRKAGDRRESKEKVKNRFLKGSGLNNENNRHVMVSKEITIFRPDADNRLQYYLPSKMQRKYSSTSFVTSPTTRFRKVRHILLVTLGSLIAVVTITRFSTRPAKRQTA